LYDPAALDWSDEMLSLFGLTRMPLPRCVPTRHAFGRLRLGSHAVPLVACTGDQSAAAFAFGRPDAEVALVNVGTGAFVQRVEPDGAKLPTGLLRSVLFADASDALHCHEGTVNGAGSALDWLRDHAALDVDRTLAALPEVLTEADVPLFMNGVGGLGAPFWQPDFPTSFVGDGDDRARLAAVLESVAFLLQENIAVLQRSTPLRRIRISGGLARSAYLCRCLASVSGLPVERYALDEATARGVAFLAAGEPASWRPIPVERVFEPSGDAALSSRHAHWKAEMAQRGAVVSN
jgi:glycerol kinase